MISFLNETATITKNTYILSQLKECNQHGATRIYMTNLDLSESQLNDMSKKINSYGFCYLNFNGNESISRVLRDSKSSFMKDILNSSITEISFSNCDLSNDDIQFIADKIIESNRTDFSSLNISYNPKIDDASFENLYNLANESGCYNLATRGTSISIENRCRLSWLQDSKAKIKSSMV
jgi:hypothetical protein